MGAVIVNPVVGRPKPCLPSTFVMTLSLTPGFCPFKSKVQVRQFASGLAIESPVPFIVARLAPVNWTAAPAAKLLPVIVTVRTVVFKEVVGWIPEMVGLSSILNSIEGCILIIVTQVAPVFVVVAKFMLCSYP